MLRYAVVGAGGYPGTHIERIRRHGPELGCELAAVAIRPEDRQGGQAEQFAADGVEVFADAVEMFDATAGRIDAAFIPTSIYTHCELACAAMARGHHVYLEKPPAATVQEVDRMLAASAESGRMCCLGVQSIFGESLNLVKSRIVSGELGQVKRLACRSRAPRPDKYYARNEWAGRLKVGDAWVLDGPSNNALSHQIADMLYLASAAARTFATPRTVRAELYHAREIESEDTSSIEIHTAEGPVAYFVVSHCADAHDRPLIEVECSAGRASWEDSGLTRISYADGRVESLDGDPVLPQVLALANFTEAVRAGDADLLKCDLKMGRNFTLALNGAFESAGRIRAIPAEFSRRVGEGPDARTVVDGMDEAILRCAAEGKLYSDIGCDWAEPTEPFDLTGYSRFPQRFKP